jgi:hypothetical protein
MAAVNPDDIRRLDAKVDRQHATVTAQYLELREDLHARFDQVEAHVRTLREMLPTHAPPPVAPPIEGVTEEEPGTIILSPSRARSALKRFAACVKHWAWTIGYIAALLGTGSAGGIIAREMVAAIEEFDSRSQLEGHP